MRADNPHASITEQAALLSEQWKAMPEAAKERYRFHAPPPLLSPPSAALLCIGGYILRHQTHSLTNCHFRH